MNLLSQNSGIIGNPALGNIQDRSGVEYIQSFIPKAITIGIIIGVLLFFLMLILGAIKWITSAGDKQALETARHQISNAIIGLVILFAVYAIARLLGEFLGVSILSLDIGSLIIQ